MPTQVRDIKYLNKSFADFKQALINYAQTYFPQTLNDFTDADPATLFIEMASYVGDVLSYYQDNQLQEAFLLFAQEKDNLLALAYALGYRPKVTSTATVLLNVYQLLPNLGTGSNSTPDFNYGLLVDKGTTIQSVSNPAVSFITQDPVNFTFSSSYDPTNVYVYQIDQTSGDIQYYLAQKQVKAIAGTIKTVSFSFGNPQRFSTIVIQDTDIIQILSAVDSNGNTWYEVPFLAQATIFDGIQNNGFNDPSLAGFNNTEPYLLRLKKVPRRFVSRLRSDDTLEIEFGPGVLSTPDEEVIPNPDNVGIGLVDGIDKINTAFDPSNFLYTKDYGLAPSNTTITFTYIVGGGIASNVPSNDITNITNAIVSTASPNAGSDDPTLLAQIINSVAFNNVSGSQGGGDGDSIQDLRNNTLASFPTQLRCVTEEDYSVRAMSLPPQFGSIAKVYVIKDDLLNSQVNIPTPSTSNPLSLSMYILAYDNNKNLVTATLALKQNLKTYLSEFKMLTDAINIKDAFVINITVNFDIVVLPNYNGKQVLTDCLNALKVYFDIDSWQINQPIIISDIVSTIAQVKGVQNVVNVQINNITGDGTDYSVYGYDIPGATRNGTVYPSLDIMIFEVQNVDTDIFGRVVTI